MSFRSSKVVPSSSSGARNRPEPGKLNRSLNNKDKITKMQADLDETKNILHNTIEGVLERGEKIDDLATKADNLSAQSKLFYKTAKKTNPDRKKARSLSRAQRTTRIVVDETPSDMEQKQRILKNLNIRFTNCTFTYKTPHFADSTPKKTGIRNLISSTIQRINETISGDHSYNECLFVPLNEEEKVKNFVQTKMPDIGVSFESCKFIKRSSTLTEKIRRTFRKVFGIQFELFYLNATATVDGYKFKVNDICDVYQYIQERIVEEE